jgi:nucleoid DNA-binding protein
MTRKDLVAFIADKEGCTKVEAARQVDAVLDAIEAALTTDPIVDLFGFGKFTKEHKPAKSGVALGKPYTSSAKNVVKFKAAKALNDTLNP